MCRTHPHLAQVPVIVVGLVLVSQFSAQDDAVLPTLKAEKHTTFFVFFSDLAMQPHCRRACPPPGGTGESGVTHRTSWSR